MDPCLFLEKYLPQIDAPRPDFNKESLSVVAEAEAEDRISRSFIDNMSPFAPTLKFVDTHSSPDLQWDGIAVDLSIYPATLDWQDEIAQTDFSRIEIPIGFNKKENYDPFCDNEEPSRRDREPPRYPFEREGLKYELIRGQMGAYTTCLYAAQFRLFSFSVLICGKWERLFRWDRSGVIVTRRFAYAEEDHLVEFLWRYSHIPDGDPSRGYDPSVTAFASNEESQTKEQVFALKRMAKANRGHREFRTMFIPDRNTEQESQFIVSYPPHPLRYSPFGRATRPMPAFDVDRNMLVFVKDYWRSINDCDQKEGDIYQLLENAKVPYIATFGKGNDVRDRVTLTNTLKFEDWACRCGKLESLRHYRMSLEEIGRLLNTFKSSHELVTAVADAMEVLEYAYHDAKILHRDISAGNIVITTAGRGMLIDWDFCLNLNGIAEDARKPQRMGTWEFMSIHLLRNLKHLHGILDDQESSIYVILWNMLRYTPHNRLEKIQYDLQIFNELTNFAENDCDNKTTFLIGLHRAFSFKDRPLLTKLLWTLCNIFSARYEIFQEEEGRFPSAFQHRPSEYHSCLEKLHSRKWLVQTMRQYLEPRDQWPMADGPCRNPGIDAS